MNIQPKPPQPAAAISESDKNAIIMGVLVAMLLAALDQMIVAPAMPTIGAALGDAVYLPWIVTAYLITATAMAPLYGKFSDIYGRRAAIATAIAIFLAGSLISALAPSMLMLIIGRAVQGLGGGGLIALAQTVIGDLVPPRERARYIAWISGTWATASVAGPVLGGYFAEHLHWSLIFWINFPLGLIALVVMNGPLKKLAIPHRRHRIDIAAALLLIAATSLLMLALNWGGHTYPWLSPPIIGLIGASIILWALFGWRLVRAEEPLISLKALGNPIVLAAGCASFMGQFGFVGMSVYMPVYLQQVLGLQVDTSGLALMGLLLGTVVGANTAGRLMMRITHYKRVAIVGTIGSALCFAALGWTVDSRSFLLSEALMFGAGIGCGTLFPTLTISVQNAVGMSHLGVATGVNVFLRSLGGAIGVAAMGAVALAYGLPLAREGGASAPGAAAAADAFGMIFYAASASMVAALVAVALMEEKPLQGRADREA